MAEYKAYGMRLEAGQALIQSVEDAFASLAAPFCDVHGFGELRQVTLQVDDGAGEQYFEGPLQLVDFRGRLRRAGDVIIADYFCSVARLTDNGVEVLGGKITDADIEFVELTFLPVEMLADQPTVASAPPKRPPVPPSPSPVTQSTAGKKNTGAAKSSGVLSDKWAKAVLESKKVMQDADFLDDGLPDVKPKRGDFVLHQQFGECKVTRMDDDHITLRKPDGRNVQLGIPILSFTRTGEKEGRDVFQVKVNMKK